MTAEDGQTLIRDLCKEADNACNIAKVAQRNGRSLSGDNFYGKKFHLSVVSLSTLELTLKPVLAGLGLGASHIEDFDRHVVALKSATTSKKARLQVQKELRLFSQLSG
jgi:hypothetical protein